MSLRRVYVLGLGNPKPYLNTLHSAGNIVLEALQARLPTRFPAFTREKYGKDKTLVSNGARYTLLRSPVFMNVSGGWCQRVWNAVARENGAEPADVGLVLVHDDLEEPLGVVKVRPWSQSPRGHNGIKHAKTQLRPFAGHKWARISVGIGRPEERDQTSVSDWVLRPLTAAEAVALRDEAPAKVLAELERLEAAWTEALVLSAAARAEEHVGEGKQGTQAM